MAKFDTIIRGLARSVSKTQRTLDAQASEKIREYRNDAIRSLFPAPRAKIKNANMNFKFAISNIEDNDDTAHLNLIFKSDELAELSEKSIQNINIKISIDSVDVISDTDIDPPNDVIIPDDSNDPDPSHDQSFFIHNKNQGGFTFTTNKAESVIVHYRKRGQEFHNQTMEKINSQWLTYIPAIDEFSQLSNGEVIEYFFIYSYSSNEIKTRNYITTVSGIVDDNEIQNFKIIEYGSNLAKIRFTITQNSNINYLQFRYRHTNDTISPSNNYHVPVNNVGSNIYEAELNHGSKFIFKAGDQIAFYLYYQADYIEYVYPPYVDENNPSTWEQHTYIGPL